MIMYLQRNAGPPSGGDRGNFSNNRGGGFNSGNRSGGGNFNQNNRGGFNNNNKTRLIIILFDLI